MSDAALARLDRALATATPEPQVERSDLLAKRDALLAHAGVSA